MKIPSVGVRPDSAEAATVVNDEWRPLKSRLESLSPTWTRPDPDGAVSRTMPDTALAGNGRIGLAAASGNGRYALILSAGAFWNANPIPSPAGLGRISVGSGASLERFSERQNLATGRIETECVIDGIPVSVQSWAASGSDVTVIAITSLQDATATVPLTLQLGAADRRPDYPSTIDPARSAVARSTADGAGPVRHAAMVLDGIEPDGIETEGVETGRSSADSIRGMLTLPGRDTVVVRVAIAVSTDSVSGAIDGAIEQLLIAESPLIHAEWWRDYWLRSWIDIAAADDDGDLERFYFTALYHLACSSRPGAAAPGIGGVWATSDDPLWFGDLHLNYNAQAPFYGVHSSNRGELAVSFIDAVVAFLPEARRRSREDLASVDADYVAGRPDLADGIEGGALFPVGISPFGTVTTVGYYRQVINGIFAANIAARHWRYTRDIEDAERGAYDLMVAVAGFYERWSEWDADTGRVVIWSGPHEGTWGRNSSPDVALLGYLLETLLDVAEALDRDRDRRERWRHLLDHLPSVPTVEWDGQTVFALADPGTLSDGRDIRPGDNSINLEFVHPGERLDIRSAAADRAIAVTTIDVMDAWSQDNSFPKIFTQAARVGYPPEKLLRRLRHELRARSAANGRVTDPYHGLEKAGTVEAINSMLVQSVGGVVSLFPAWPRSLDASFVRLRTEGGFLVSAILADGVVRDVRVQSTVGGRFRMVSPDSEPDDVVEIDTIPGGDYRVID